MNRTTSGGLVLLAALSAAALFALRSTGAPEGEKAPPPEEARELMQCPMMAGLRDLRLHADSPAVLLLQAEDLKLTDRQKQRLEEIADAARRQARAVLDDRQREQIEEAPEGPVSLMELSRSGLKMDKGGAAMMCPTCTKMMQQMHEKDPRKGEKRDRD